MSAGAKLWDAVAKRAPVQIPGAVNAYCALLAERAGFEAIYLSGAGVANASFGLPDLGVTTLNDVVEDARRITAATDLPLLVDADTGFGSAFNIARTVRELERAGVAGMHIEDQEQAKRCGHRPNKATVSTGEMCDRLKAAVDARSDREFVIMARTDAFAREGMQASVERAVAYVAAGADMVFAEALYSLDDYRAFTHAIGVPVLANLTEFGLTPLFKVDELGDGEIRRQTELREVREHRHADRARECRVIFERVQGFREDHVRARLHVRRSALERGFPPFARKRVGPRHDHELCIAARIDGGL